MTDEKIIQFAAHKGRGNLPVIQLAEGAFVEVAEQAERALLLSGQPIYRRGNRLVTPDIRKVEGADGLQTVSAVLAEITLPYLREFMDRSARFERFNIRKKQWLPVQPPKDIAELILARVPQWRFEEVDGILTSPTLGQDGSILNLPGFEETTRLFFAELPLLPRLVEEPDKDAAIAALADLNALLSEFPFVDDVARAIALSAMLTLVCRGAMALAPMHAMSAPEPGSGKSYLFDIVSVIATGQPCPVITPGRGTEEMEKRIGGLILAGQPCVSLDNVGSVLSSAMLCQALERPRVLVRLLGSSVLSEAAARTVWFATGINLTVADDLTRRVLIGRLDSDMERPELRSFRSDPVATVMRERGRYIGACLTIARAYIVAGAPGRLPRLASYSAWSDLIRSALVWLGCADPCASIEATRENDPTLQLRTAFFAAWPTPDAGYTTAELIRLSDPDGDYGKTDAGIALHQAMVTIAPGARGKVDATALGKWLSANRGRIVSGRKLDRVAAGHASRWWIRSPKVG